MGLQQGLLNFPNELLQGCSGVKGVEEQGNAVWVVRLKFCAVLCLFSKNWLTG